MKYKDHILAMQHIEGFYSKYCSLLGDYPKNEEAYDAAERLYQSHFGQRRFKTFESFKSTLSQHLKKRRNDSKQP